MEGISRGCILLVSWLHREAVFGIGMWFLVFLSPLVFLACPRWLCERSSKACEGEVSGPDMQFFPCFEACPFVAHPRPSKSYTPRNSSPRVRPLAGRRNAFVSGSIRGV
jgi:hypothetical protein